MGGAPSLPTPSTPGYTSFRGFTACECLAKWLPVYERLLLLNGLVKSSIDIWQLTGAAAASAGTHSQGGAADLFQYTNAHVAISREMGAPAAWRRTTAQGFTKDHQHLVLTGCPHNDPARYQIAAQRDGYDGLGYLGHAGPDYHPDPKVYRTWQQGITWAEAEIARLEEEMLTPKDFWSYPMASPDGTTYTAESFLVNANVKAGKALAQATAASDKADAMASALGKVLAEVLNLPAEVGAELEATLKDAVVNVQVNFPPDPPATP